MGQTTEISWTDATANLWWGCQEVHDGCDNCYARELAKRYGHHDIWGPKTARRPIAGVWKNLRELQARAYAVDRRFYVFVGSMMDIFETPKPLTQQIKLPGETTPALTTAELRHYFFHKVVPECPNLIFQLLTKRPGNILKLIPDHWRTSPPENVIYGCTVVDQPTADRDVPLLLDVPGYHFLSVEPMLGPVDLSKVTRRVDAGMAILVMHGLVELPSIHQVICGGESGPHRRPFEIEWAQQLHDQCKAAHVPFWMKQDSHLRSGQQGRLSDELFNCKEFPEVVPQ